MTQVAQEVTSIESMKANGSQAGILAGLPVNPGSQSVKGSESPYISEIVANTSLMPGKVYLNLTWHERIGEGAAIAAAEASLHATIMNGEVLSVDVSIVARAFQSRFRGLSWHSPHFECSTNDIARLTSEEPFRDASDAAFICHMANLWPTAIARRDEIYAEIVQVIESERVKHYVKVSALTRQDLDITLALLRKFELTAIIVRCDWRSHPISVICRTDEASLDLILDIVESVDYQSKQEMTT